MAKAILRFGFVGEQHAARILPIKAAAEIAESLDFVHGRPVREHLQGFTPADAKFFTVSRRCTRVSVNCPNGYFIEVEYVHGK